MHPLCFPRRKTPRRRREAKSLDTEDTENGNCHGDTNNELTLGREDLQCSASSVFLCAPLW